MPLRQYHSCFVDNPAAREVAYADLRRVICSAVAAETNPISGPLLVRDPTTQRSTLMAKVVCVLYDDPVDGYPKSYARDDIPKIEKYPDGQTAPTPKAIDFKPGQLLGSVSGRAGPAQVPRRARATSSSSPPTRTAPTRSSTRSCPTRRS